MLYLDIHKKVVTIYNLGKNNKRKTKSIKAKSKATFKIKEEHNTLKAADYRIIKFNISKKESIDNLFGLLKKEKIIISEDNPYLEKFLDEYDIRYTIESLCHNCLKFNMITFIDKKSSHEYNKHWICDGCLDMVMVNILEEYDYSFSSLKIFKKIYEKTGDLNLVFDMIEQEFDPVENPELTLYDRFENTEDDYERVSIIDVDIPCAFQEILKQRIDYLLPVQILALKSGLLDDENLLVVSQTASGKTLIAELAGITKALKRRKFIYLSPLVALANQKYRQFKRDYERLGLKVAIKVGKNRVRAEDELTIEEMSLDDADIIVATYEGLDFILRSGQYHLLNPLGVVVIDEIHMLEDIERGCRLNGLIRRLMHLFSQIQLIALSATINNPKELAKEFNMTLVEYDKRPVALDRHLVFCNDLKNKNKIIEDLCNKEYANTSSKGYKGQTIIFTDSRRKTNMISHNLEKKGVKSQPYHAGLTYAKKLSIEEAFANQEISVVVTTAALASGVDFPASQVIFESLRMGRKWLTNNEFHQMLGRAGRPSYHDKAVVYLLPVTDYYMNHELEEDVAYKLLDSSVDDINVHFGFSDVYEQILSDISAEGSVDIEELENKYSKYELPVLFNDAVNELYECDMIEYNLQDKKYHITDYGRATSMSFLRLDQAEYIRKHITDNLIDIITILEPFNNAYLSGALIKSFEKMVLFNVSTRLFSDSTKEIISKGYYISQLSKKLQSQLSDLTREFMICDCWEKPFCSCLEENVSRHIINRRLEGFDPFEISKEFIKNYSIKIYSGDIYNWLDQAIRYCESIGRIADSLDIKEVSIRCEKLTRQIEFGGNGKSDFD